MEQQSNVGLAVQRDACAAVDHRNGRVGLEALLWELWSAAPGDAPSGNRRTTPHPRHAEIMNGPVDESLLINYGGNRVLLTQ